jgi:hypothetical protein
MGHHDLGAPARHASPHDVEVRRLLPGTADRVRRQPRMVVKTSRTSSIGGSLSDAQWAATADKKGAYT